MSLKYLILSASLLLIAGVLAAIDPNHGGNIPQVQVSSEAL